MKQWIMSESFGKKYCSDDCFQSELPKCSACGKKMRSWITSEQGGIYCSEECYSTSLPKCHCCGKVMKEWTESETTGKKYCSESCFATEYPRCEHCGKAMKEFITSSTSGKNYCSEECFSSEYPVCTTCGKPMSQWITSSTSGKVYCNDECMSVEFPLCVVCGRAMKQWFIAEDEKKYCSEACISKTYPLCETCLSPMISCIEDDNGNLFCSTLCKETDSRCTEIAEGNRQRRLSGADIAGMVSGAAITSDLYADQVLFNTGRRVTATGLKVQTGHGVAAEHANHMMDRMTLQDATHVGADNLKNGPDRVVNNQAIQTKYLKTGNACVDSCFDNKSGGLFKYIDSNGQPMKIEVPKDKYDQSVERMRAKISEGKVPGITDPDKATEIVRKGWFTHNQAKNLVRFGTIESVTYDAVNGIRVGFISGSISAILSFSVALWQGKDLKQAGKQAAYAGIKIGGTGFISTIAVEQIGRTGVEQSLRGVTNAAAKQLGPRVCAAIAHGMGKSGLHGAAASNYVSKLFRGNIVTGTVVTVVLSAKDIFYMFDGQISFAQACKNIVTTTATVGGGYVGSAAGGSAGAAAGALAGSVVPVVGTAIGAFVGGVIGFLGGAVGGGAVAGSVTNATLGLFIEDDATSLSKEFQTITASLAESFILDEAEVSSLSSKIQNMDLSKTLREMYCTSNRRSFVASKIKPLLVEITATRSPIKPLSTEQLLSSVEDLLEEVSAESLA
jgi:hypothetical protein